jgi:hypothetical protein
MPAPQPLFTPLRDTTMLRASDLINTQNACLAHSERILFEARLPVECALATSWGLLVEQSRAFRRWRPDPEKTERCHLLDKTELDGSLGIYALSTRAIDSDSIAGQYVGICSWRHLSDAAEYLWSECLGHAIADRYFGLEKHLADTVSVLGLQERPVNHQPPGYSMTRNGALLRFDAATVPAFNRYFLLDEILDPTDPVSIELGADCSLLYVYSADPVEPVQAIIVSNPWNVPIAVKELRRSLSRNRKAASFP